MKGDSSLFATTDCRLTYVCLPDSTALFGMLEWADYVRHVATVDHRLCRDRGTGQYVDDRPATFNATTARPHMLMMMRRGPAAGRCHQLRRDACYGNAVQTRACR